VRRFLVLLPICLFVIAADARASVTSLLLTGDPGDYISGGRTYFYTPADGLFTVNRNYHNGVSLSFHTPSYSHWWYVDFSAPGQQSLAVGVYSGALRFPFEGSQAGLDVSGDGRGCNTLQATFEVKEVTYGSSGAVLSFWATFEQHCEGFAPAARGEIRYNATVALELTTTTAISGFELDPIAFGVTGADVLGRHVTLSATGLPSGATFVDNGDNTGTFVWTPGYRQAGTYLVTFRGDNGAGNSETVFSTIVVMARPPVNDDISRAIPITDVPSTFTAFTTLATWALDDPFCGGAGRSVWYAFTPATDMRVEMNTFGSDYDTTLSVYTGTRGSLTQLACNDNAGKSPQSRIRFDAQAGVTYWVMAGAYYGSAGGQLVLNVLEPPPPLSIALTLAGFGDVDAASGEAAVIGRITCSRPVLVTISGQLKQDRGQDSLTGTFALVVSCNGTSDWSAPVVVPLSLFEGRAADLFAGGKATITASASASDQDAGETAHSNAAARIVLRGKR